MTSQNGPLYDKSFSNTNLVIVKVRDHYELQTTCGKFVVSADTFSEIMDEFEKLEIEGLPHKKETR